MTIGNKYANTAIDHGNFAGTDKAIFKATLFVCLSLDTQNTDNL